MALPDHRFQTPMSEVDPKRQVSRAKNITSAYTLTNLLQAEKHMDRLIELLETRLGELADRKMPVEFDKWFNYMAFDMVGEMTFSSSFGFLESGKDIGGAIANTRALTLYTAVAGFFYTVHRMTLGNPLVTKLGLMPSQHIFDTTLRAIERRKENPEVRFDMLEHWKQTLAQHPDRMEENELYGVTNMTIGAGADTISATLQAFFYYLIRYPVHLDKVKAEISNANTSKVVSYGETQNLPFLRACVGIDHLNTRGLEAKRWIYRSKRHRECIQLLLLGFLEWLPQAVSRSVTISSQKTYVVIPCYVVDPTSLMRATGYPQHQSMGHSPH
jgi:hypothetical protein